MARGMRLLFAGAAPSYTMAVQHGSFGISGQPATMTYAPAPPPALTISATGGGSPVAGVPFNLSALLSNATTLPDVGTWQNVSGSGSATPPTVTFALGDLNKTSALVWASAGSVSVRMTTASGVVSNTLALTVSAASPPPPAPTGAVPQYLTHDGGTVTSGSVGNFGGPTDTLWHKRLGKAWERIYAPGNAKQGLGNWLDSAQTAEGAVPYASTGVASSVDQVLTATVTTLVQRWLTNGLNRGFYLNSRIGASDWPIDFYGRGDATSGNRPKLTVVTSTGTTVLTAKANACWNKSSFAGVSAAVAWRLSAGQQPAILRFDLSGITGTLTSATLSIKVKAFDTGHTGHIVDVFEADPPALVLPEDVASPLQGIAAEYADFNTMKSAVGSDSRLMFADDFQSPGWADAGFTPAASRVLNPATGTYYAVGTIQGGGPPGSGTGSANVRKDVSVGVGTGVPGVSGGGVITPTVPELFGQYWLYLEDNFGTQQDDAIKIPAMGVQFGWWNPVGYWQSTTGNGGYPGTGLKVFPAVDSSANAAVQAEYQGHSVRLLTGTAPLTGDDDPYDGYFGVYIYPYNLDQVGGFPASPAFPAIVIRKGAWYCVDIRVKQNSMSGSQDALGNYATANADGVWQCWINGLSAYSKTDYRWRRHPEMGVQGMWIDVYHGGQSPALVDMNYRVDRVVLASAYIGPPAPSLPTWVPAAGRVTTLTTTNGKLTNTFSSQVAADIGYLPFYSKKIVNDYSGATANPYYGTYGAMIFEGGGHSATNDNSIIQLELGATSCSFRRVVKGTNWFPSSTVDNNLGFITGLFDSTWFDSNADGKPLSRHSYGDGVVIGPADGGAAYGTYRFAFSNGGYAGYIPALGHSPHKLPFDSIGGTYTWARAAAAPNSWTNADSPLFSCFVPAQGRIYVHKTHFTGVRWQKVSDETFGLGTGTGLTDDTDSPGGGAGENGGMLRHIPSRNLLIYCDRKGGNLRIRYMSVGVADTDPSWVNAGATLSIAIPVGYDWSHIDWVPRLNKLIVGNVSGDPNCVYEIALPASLPGTWTCTRVAFTGGDTLSWGSGGNGYGKWSYIDQIRGFAYLPQAVDSGTDTVYVYRPQGT